MIARKDKNGFRKNWPDLRAEISKVIAEKQLLETNFRPLSIYGDWKQIEEKVYQTFCNSMNFTQMPTWLWTNFKLDTFSVSNLQKRPETYLDKLVEKNEKVWYVVNETINESDKLWFYEGKIETIQSVINETWFNELCLISKKYEWLICINHHDCLIATGNFMPNKSRELAIESDQK